MRLIHCIRGRLKIVKNSKLLLGGLSFSKDCSRQSAFRQARCVALFVTFRSFKSSCSYCLSSSLQTVVIILQVYDNYRESAFRIQDKHVRRSTKRVKSRSCKCMLSNHANFLCMVKKLVTQIRKDKKNTISG